MESRAGAPPQGLTSLHFLGLNAACSASIVRTVFSLLSLTYLDLAALRGVVEAAVISHNEDVGRLRMEGAQWEGGGHNAASTPACTQASSGTSTRRVHPYAQRKAPQKEAPPSPELYASSAFIEDKCAGPST